MPFNFLVKCTSATITEGGTSYVLDSVSGGPSGHFHVDQSGLSIAIGSILELTVTEVPA
jgi:hypothetical protein